MVCYGISGVVNNIVSHPIPEYLLKRLQRVQLAAAGFVLGRYEHMPHLIKLGWMPMKEHIEYQSLNTVFKALHYNDWPSYLYWTFIIQHEH